MRRKLLMVMLSTTWAMLACPLSAGERTWNLRASPAQTNFFAGQAATMNYEVSSPGGGDAVLSWTFSFSGAVVARGEKAVVLNAERATPVTWKVDVPDVKPGVIAPAALELRVATKFGPPQFQKIVPLTVWSADATALRQEWLKSLDIVLFDPAELSARMLEEAQIPVRIAGDPDCAQLTNGMILYGEGIEPARMEAVWSAAVEAMAQGRRVLVLASPGAVVPLEGLLTSSENSLRSVTLKQREAVGELDRRLDAIAWPQPGRLVASSLQLSVRAGSPCVEFTSDTEGWQWLEVRHRSGGRLIWVGFGIMESWEATPAARYFLLKILEDLSVDKVVKESSDEK